jgi:hypothetical protein
VSPEPGYATRRGSAGAPGSQKGRLALFLGLDGKSGGEYTGIMDLVIEFNPAAFKHQVTEADIRWAFDTATYDAWFNKGDEKGKDKYLLIGFDRKGNPLEILYNVIDDKTINVFHAMKCRNIYYHLLQKED